MKFVLRASNCSARMGVIKEIHRLPGVTIETPMFLLPTKGGSVPHLTHEVLQMVSQEPVGIQVPLPSVMHSEHAVKDFKKGLSTFIGLTKYLTYCTVQDSAVPWPSGFNTSTTVSIFSLHGRQQLDPNRYMDIMEAFSPDMYQILCDSDTNTKCSKKRLSNSASRTAEFAKKCIERHKKSEILQNKAILGVIQGGYDSSMRRICAKEMVKHSVTGFVIDGFHTGGPDVETIMFKDIRTALKETLACLPDHKFRVVHGCWNPQVILDLINVGIDIVDGSYPHIVTERCGALIFCYDKNSSEKEFPEDTEYFPDGRRKYEINLKDKRHFDDFGPLKKSCSCLTCRDHTRSYVHHLLERNELLGMVLLMIHNIHHYLEFFKAIRNALNDGTWEDYHKWFTRTL